MHRILVINPGSTSTKIAVYEDSKQIFESDIRHTPEQLAQFQGVWDQEPFRLQVVIDELNKQIKDIKKNLTEGQTLTCGAIARNRDNGTYSIRIDII